MTQKYEFPQSVIEQIQSYVYLLRDPRDGQIFYIGKGLGNRIFQHVTESLANELPSDKLDRIRTIHKAGLEVDHQIIRHGLTEDKSFEIEAALIDFVGLQGLTNLVQGHYSDTRGLMTVSEVIANYAAAPAVINEPVILITVNKAYRRGMPMEVLYEFTRGKWKVGKRGRENSLHAFAVYRGIIRQVFDIHGWHEAPAEDSVIRRNWIETQGIQIQLDQRLGRWEFDGSISQDLQHYVGKDVTNYQQIGAQNPIRYVNF